MRQVFRCVLAVIGASTLVAAAPAATSMAAATVPTIASVLPARGEVVGVAHPVVMTFSTPVADRLATERSLDVTSTPAMTGTYEWLSPTSVQWVPDKFWPAHSTVALSMGRYKTEFVTGAEVIGTADLTAHTFTVRIDGVDTGPPSEVPTPHHRPHWGEPGVLPASMGRAEYPTPVGTYTVLGKDRTVFMDSSSVGIPVSAPDGYQMDVDFAVRITSRGLFVHSAPWAVNSMGYENVSHGCINLSPEDAEWYYNTVNVGDPVIIQENSIEVPRTVTR